MVNISNKILFFQIIRLKVHISPIADDWSAYEDVSALIADVRAAYADVGALIADVGAAYADVSAIMADVSALIADVSAAVSVFHQKARENRCTIS